MRRLFLLLAVCGPLSAAGQERVEKLAGVGRVSLQAGWRLTPNGDLAARARAEEPVPPATLPRSLGEVSSSGGPLAAGTFAYAVTDLVEVGIDLFTGTESLQLADLPRVRSVTYGALLGVRFQHLLRGIGPLGLVPALGLMTGPTLVWVRPEGGQASEVVNQAWVGTAGATLKLTPRWGVTLEYRLVFADGLLPSGYVFDGPPQRRSLAVFNAGGHWFGLGLTYTFPPRPDRPRGLGSRL